MTALLRTARMGRRHTVRLEQEGQGRLPFGIVPVPRLLSVEDRFYLSLYYDCAEERDGDPQAELVYAVESNETNIESPVWTRDQAASWLQAMATRRGLRVKVLFRPRVHWVGLAFAGRGGGTVFLPVDCTPTENRDVSTGEYLASVVAHELAHIVAVTTHWGTKIESHGPEFVAAYLDVLSEVMPTERTRESFAYLNVRIADSQGVNYSVSANAASPLTDLQPTARAVRQVGISVTDPGMRHHRPTGPTESQKTRTRTTPVRISGGAWEDPT